jgi:hypothetical protein
VYARHGRVVLQELMSSKYEKSWGPRALNYNALCHPEVLTSKPGSSINKTDLNTLKSTVIPRELNLNGGLAGT